MWRTSNFAICSLSPSSCRGPIPTWPQLAAHLALGIALELADSAGYQVTPKNWQEGCWGGHTALGCWAVVLARSCHRVAAGTACGDLVLVSQSRGKGKHLLCVIQPGQLSQVPHIPLKVRGEEVG